MSEEEKKETVKEKVNKLATINFWISKCPTEIYEDFVSYCKAETNENYSFGLKLLLDSQKINAKEEVMFKNIQDLAMDIKVLQDKIAVLEDAPVKKKKIKTMGSDKDGKI